MEGLIIIGAILSAIGLVVIVVSLLRVLRARRAGLDEAALRAAISRALPLNLGGFLLSVLGLAMVVVGVLLG